MSNLLALCIKTTGSVAAGVLLYRICYWQKYAKIEREGHRWVAKSREEWLHETSLSETQYRHAISLLKEEKLIVGKQAIYGRKNIFHVRLSARGEMLQSVKNDELESVKYSNLESVKNDELYTKGDTEIEIHKGSDFVFTNTQAQPEKEEFSGEAQVGVDTENNLSYNPEVKEDITVVTVKEMLANSKMKKSNIGLTTKLGSSSSLQSVWKHHCGMYVGLIPQKMAGQLTNFGKACPEGKAEEVLQVVLSDWQTFASVVKSGADLKSVPSVPSIDFLLKYALLAIDFASPKTKQHHNVVSKGNIQKPVQLIAQNKSDPVATAEELSAILNDEEEE